MILVVDVGNTNTVLGAMKNGKVLHRWRISTVMRTTDEMGLLLLQLIERQGLSAVDFYGVAVSCVVPSVLYAIEKASKASSPDTAAASCSLSRSSSESSPPRS